jgi:hypothetical protein
MLASNKDIFLSYDLGTLTVKSALSTRDDEYPVYSKSCKPYQRSDAKKAIRVLLAEIERKYAAKSLSEPEHISFISEVAEDFSNRLKDFLHNGRFRVGIAQKLVNIHLKYLWTADLCPEPPHCPIDGIIRDLAGIGYTWTQSDSIEEYRSAISDLKKLAEIRGCSLAQWELEVYKRRED